MKKMSFEEIKNVLNAFTMNNENLYTNFCKMAEDYAVNGEEPDKLMYACYMLESWFDQMNNVFIRDDLWYCIIPDEELLEIWAVNEEDWEELVKEAKFNHEELIKKLEEGD